MSENCTYFQSDVFEWHTSQLEYAESMLNSATTFDSDPSWNNSSLVTVMNMFGDATSFHDTGLNSWETSRLESARSMFNETSSFDGALPWNTSFLVNTQVMFSGATAFQGNGLERWDTARISITFMEAIGICFPSTTKRGHGKCRGRGKCVLRNK